jgi:type I restriction enzyme S subunit
MSDGNGELPDGWARVTLEELGMSGSKTVDPSKDPDKEFELWSVPTFPTGMPEIQRGADIGSAKQQVQPGDVLLCKINPRINRVWVVEERRQLDQIASSEWIVFRNGEVDPRFLMHRLREGAFRERLCADVSGVGGSLTRARPQTVKNLEITLPPLAEQRRIVSKIESLQERSSRARRALSEVGPLLEQFRQSVLRAAFSGRLTADWRAAHCDVEPATELLSRIRTERRHRWEQSELAKYEAKGKKPPKNWQQRYKEAPPLEEPNLPELPDGWVWTSADDICSQITDGEHVQPKYTDSGFPMLTAKHVRDGFVTFEAAGLISKDDFDRCLARCAPTKDDILIVSVGATTGRTAIVDECQPFALVRSVLLLKPLMTPRFLLGWTKSPWCFRWMTSASGATAQAHLYIAATKKMPVPVPPLEEQLEITRIIDEAQERYSYQLDVVAESESSLTQLNQSILAKAFRGELVPQDPRDEPASELLARIRTTREATSPNKTARSRRKSAKASE